MTKLLKTVIDSLRMPDTPTWGGKRKGAGRKPLEGETQKRREIVLTETRWARVKALGKGNFSQGVRALLDFHAKHTKRRK